MTTLGAGIPQAKISPTCIYTSYIWPPLDPSCTALVPLGCCSSPTLCFWGKGQEAGECWHI